MRTQKIAVACVLLFSLSSFHNSVVKAQENKIEYNRSSLHLVLLDVGEFPNRNAVMTSWNNYPFPDKYDQHEIDLISFNPLSIEITDEEKIAAGIVENPNLEELGLPSASIFSPEDELIPLQIEKYVKDNKIANKLVEKWFVKDGVFNLDLVEERGIYNASELEKAVAQSSATSKALLVTAGEELIANTFIVFSKLNFVSNEPIAYAAYEIAKAQAEKIPNELVRSGALTAAEAAYEKAREGYSVWTKSWLYRLEWDAETSDLFFNSHWDNLTELRNSNEYSLKLLGRESSASVVLFKIGEQRTEEQIIDIATVRNVDNTFSKLQKSYEQFQPVITVNSVNPITAQIGTKEGLKGKEKFDVLEQVIDPVTKKVEYKKVATIKVEKGKVWDNMYDPDKQDENTESKGTQFSKSNKVQVGMILKQVK